MAKITFDTECKSVYHFEQIKDKSYFISIIESTEYGT